MANFVGCLLLSDLETIIEARAAELKISLPAVLERIQASESEWTSAPTMDMLLRAAREVGIEIAPEQEAARDEERETRPGPAVTGPAVAPHAPTTRASAHFPVLRPSGAGNRIIVAPAGNRSPPPKAE